MLKKSSLLFFLMAMSMGASRAFAVDRILCGDRSKDSYFFDVTDLVTMPPGRQGQTDLLFKYFRSYAEKVESMICTRPVENSVTAEHLPMLHCESTRFDMSVEKGSYPEIFVADIYNKQTSQIQQGDIPCQLTSLP